MAESLLKDPKTFKALLAEFVGTMILVFIGCGSGTNWGDGVSVTQIALAVGFTLGTLVQTISHVSGSHVNPSVTVAFMITRRMNPILGILYIIVQCLGALAGTFLLKLVTPPSIAGNFGATVPAIPAIQACVVEFILTFVLVITIFGVCDEKRDDIKGSPGLAVGVAAAACCLVGIKFTGSSLNPARSLSPAIISGTWDHHWVYWVGPCLGGAIAGLLYQSVFRAHKQRPEPKARGADHDYEMCATK